MMTWFAVMLVVMQPTNPSAKPRMIFALRRLLSVAATWELLLIFSGGTVYTNASNNLRNLVLHKYTCTCHQRSNKPFIYMTKQPQSLQSTPEQKYGVQPSKQLNVRCMIAQKKCGLTMLSPIVSVWTTWPLALKQLSGLRSGTTHLHPNVVLASHQCTGSQRWLAVPCRNVERVVRRKTPQKSKTSQAVKKKLLLPSIKIYIHFNGAYNQGPHPGNIWHNRSTSTASCMSCWT
jgi:hypothetical protein